MKTVPLYSIKCYSSLYAAIEEYAQLLYVNKMKTMYLFTKNGYHSK